MTRIRTIWSWLTEPPKVITDVMTRSQARLLAIFLVILIFVFLVIDAVSILTLPGYQIPWYGYMFLGLSFFLNRKGLYGVASGLVMIMFPLVIFFLVLSESGGHVLTNLGYLILGLIAGSIFLSRRGILMLGLVNLLEIPLLYMWVPEKFPTPGTALAPFAVNLVALPLILLSIHQRDRIEDKRRSELRTATERLQLALNSASMGIWDWNILTNEVVWSDHVAQVFGLQEGEFDGRYESYLKLVYPEDLPLVEQTIADTLAGKSKDYRIEHRILWPDGTLNWLEGRGQVYRDASGKPIRMTGTVASITAHKQKDEALQRYTKRLEILHEIESGLLSAESPRAIAEVAAENVRRLAGCDRVSICLFDFQSQMVSFLAVSTYTPTLLPAGSIVPMDYYGLEIIEVQRRGENYLSENILDLDSGFETGHRFTADNVRAWFCVTLFFHGELIGSINLGSIQSGLFTQDQQNIAQEVANQLAIALHQSRLSKETTEALLREQRLNKVAQAISSTLDLQTILPTIVSLATELINAEAAGMSLISPDGETLVHPYLLNLPTGVGLEAPIPKGKGVAWKIIENKKGILIKNYQNEPDALPQWRMTGVHCFIEVPLIAGDTCLGTLGLYMLDPGRKFGLRDLALAESVGQQAGIAIQNARLFAQAQQREYEMTTLLDVARHVSSTIQLDEVLRLVAISMAQVLRMERCVISTYSEQEEIVQTRAVYSVTGEEFMIPEGEHYHLADYPQTAHILRTHHPIIVRVSDPVADPSEVNTLRAQGYALMLMLSLQIGGRPIGLAELQTKDETQTITHEEMRLVRALADQVALAIENARLFEATQRQLNELHVLHAVMLVSAMARNETEVIEDAIQEISDHYPPDHLAVWMVDAESQTLRPRYLHSRFADPDDLVLSLDEGVMSRVVKTGQSQRIGDVTKLPYYISFGQGMLSELCVPLKSAQGVIGVINIESAKLNAFSENDQRFLETLAGELMTSIERLRAEATLRANEVRHREMLEKVILLGKAITQITDLQECLQNIHVTIHTGLGFDRVGLFLYNEQKDQLQGIYGTNRKGELEDIRWYIRDTANYEIWPRLLQDPRGIHIIENYTQTYHLTEEDDMYGVRQQITLAVWAGEKPVGLVAVDNLLSQRRITAEEIEALQLFAGYIGLAIENARWSTDLEQRVAERTAQLEEANRELESFSYSVSHDLRAPLRAIDGFSTMLNMIYGHQLDTEGQRYLSQIRDNVNRMTQLINDLLAFSRLSRQPLLKRLTDPISLIHEVIKELSADLNERQVEIRVGQLPPCEADASLLRQVFANLIGNAVKYSRPREKAIIQIDWQKENDEIVYLVRDNGVGFDMQYANKLFGVFQRLHSQEAFEGTGIGLAIVHRIIYRHGGKVWARAEVNHGATFFFTLG